MSRPNGYRGQWVHEKLIGALTIWISIEHHLLAGELLKHWNDKRLKKALADVSKKLAGVTKEKITLSEKLDDIKEVFEVLKDQKEERDRQMRALLFRTGVIVQTNYRLLGENNELKDNVNDLTDNVNDLNDNINDLTGTVQTLHGDIMHNLNHKTAIVNDTDPTQFTVVKQFENFYELEARCLEDDTEYNLYKIIAAQKSNTTRKIAELTNKYENVEIILRRNTPDPRRFAQIFWHQMQQGFYSSNKKRWEFTTIHENDGYIIQIASDIKINNIGNVQNRQYL